VAGKILSTRGQEALYRAGDFWRQRKIMDTETEAKNSARKNRNARMKLLSGNENPKQQLGRGTGRLDLVTRDQKNRRQRTKSRPDRRTRRGATEPKPDQGMPDLEITQKRIEVPNQDAKIIFIEIYTRLQLSYSDHYPYSLILLLK
jgi:hypothetical protein